MSLLVILVLLQAIAGSSSVEEEETAVLGWGEDLLDNQDDVLGTQILQSSKTGGPRGSEGGGGAEPKVAGDMVKFIFDWGDGTVSETEFVNPGAVVSLSHIWDSPGVYSVRVRAEDVQGASSEWSEAIDVMIVQKVNRFVGLRRSQVS